MLCVLVIIIIIENQQKIMVDVAELKAALDKLESELEKEKQKNAQLVEENVDKSEECLSRVGDGEGGGAHHERADTPDRDDVSGEEESDAPNRGAEEEHISNALQKKLDEVMKQKVDLERQLESETEFVGNKLQRQVDQLVDKKDARKRTRTIEDKNPKPTRRREKN